METFNLPKKPKVLIFDIDATLYTCPEYAHEQIDSQIRHWARLSGTTSEEARKTVSNFRRKWAAEHGGKKISLGNLFTHFGISIEKSIEWRKTLFDPFDYLKKDEKLSETLSELKKSFYLICATNNPVAPARRTLEALGVSEQIEEIVGLDTCLASKPSRAILETAVKIASERTKDAIGFGDCVSVGDRFDIDLALPLELGMGGILVSGVEEVYETPGIFQNL